MTKRRAWLAAAGFALALVVGAAIAYAQRRALAEWYATRALAGRGIAATLAIAELDARGARIAPLRLERPGLPPLEVGEVELDWTLGGLLGRRVERAVVTGARVEGRIELPELAREPEAPGAARAFVLPVLPVDALVLEDAALEIDTAQGHFSLQGDGEGRFAEDALAGSFHLAGDTPYGPVSLVTTLGGAAGAPRAEFELRASPQPGRQKAEEQLTLQGRLHTDEAGAPRWEANGTLPFFDLPELARLEEIALEASGDAHSVRGELRIVRAIDVREPPLWAPLSVALDFEGPFTAVAFTGRAQTQDGAVHAELRGTLVPEERSADVSFRVPETELTRQRQPGQLSPRIAQVVQQAKGHIGAEGDARFEDGKLRYTADVALREVDARAGVATFRGVTGAVRFEGPPLATPPGQLLSIAAIEEPIPLVNGLVEFQLTAEGVLMLASAVFSAAKGTLSASGSLPLGAEERSLELIAQDLDVTSLLAALPFDSLSGTGTLAGTLPLRQRGARVWIEGGSLRATTPGVIRYRPVAGSEALTEQHAQLGTVLGALEDLHYDSLELEVSGDTAEELDLAVRIAGSNPNFQNGRAVRLNVNVEARLGDLVKAGQAAYRVPGEVEERVRRILDREKR